MQIEREHYDQVDDLRLLISDLDYKNPIFTDKQLQAFIRLYNGSIKRAAARALRSIAASEVLVSKVIKTQDLSTDGRAVSAELRELAKTLEDEAIDEESNSDAGTYAGFVTFGSSGRCEGEEYAYPW